MSSANDLEAAPEKVLLIGLNHKRGGISVEASIDELSQLTDTAGGIVELELIIQRGDIHPNHYLGKGKIDEVNQLIDVKSIDLVIIDDELSVRQQLQLDSRLHCRVIDRTALILQIFADRAKTREGKLQIELAQLSYLMPRLTGKGKDLSRLGGGIGTRGPGESQLEKDRRHIRNRIKTLQDHIEDIRKQRMITRAQREKNQMPVLTLVGYTNAGKSTLLNTLTQSEETAEDKLFATLDPTTRRFRLEDIDVLLTDTVGFIQQLPHSLVSAFRATLEEARFADLLIHVIDASHPEFEQQIKTVQKVLAEIGCEGKPIVYVFNKIDKSIDTIELQHYLTQYAPAVFISAKNGIGLVELKKALFSALPSPMVKAAFKLPITESHILNQFYKAGSVSSVEYSPDEISGWVLLPKNLIKKYDRFIIK